MTHNDPLSISEQKERDARVLARAKERRAIVEAGYGGMKMLNGTYTFVDRREHPDATPMAENSLLGIPKPANL